MDRKTVTLVVLAIVLCAAVVIGEVFTYGINIHSFDSKAEFSSDTLSYSVSSSGSDTYSVVLLDSNDVPVTRELYIYVDNDYDNYYRQALEKSNLEYVQQQYYSEQLKKFLGVRGFDNVTLVDSKGLKEYIENNLSDPVGKGIFVTSYALPSEIYSGKTDDILIKWIENGGNLYWSSSEIGRFYTDSEGLKEVTGNQTLFFGKECINTGKMENATSAIENGFREALTLKNSGMKFTVNNDGLADSLAMGYCEDGYSSITFTKSWNGSGMICVIGTMDEMILELDDTAQVIASEITYGSEIVDTVKGNVVRSTIDGKIDCTATGKAIAYIYIGGTYTIYGRCFIEQ